MTAAARNSGTRGLSRPFFGGLLIVMLTLVTAGVGGFWYLTANGPLTLLSGGDRPIAAATVFIPARSPLTLSLLTRPARLVAFQQAIIDPSQRQQAIREIDQIKQSLLDNTQIDYDRDIQPWIGNEITFAFTDSDLDLEQAGQQPGYLTILEIAPERQAQAREFLQLFWQRRSLTNGLPRSERVSGVRMLYASGQSPAASALVGSQFVMFANDVRVLRRSIQVAQTAASLAQDRVYRQTVAQLPSERIGLVYMDTAIARDISRVATKDAAISDSPQFAAISLGITETSLVAQARLVETAQGSSVEGVALSEPVAALAFLPANSVIALASYDLSQLESSLAEVGLSSSLLPDFLQLAPATDQTADTQTPDIPPLWNWATADYALGQVISGGRNDWILAVSREPEGIAQLDEAATGQGYSAVPVAIGERKATAWTRFKARSRSRAANSLEAEVLGLHLQQEGYEIFASSVAAIEAALSAPQGSLLDAARFTQAIAPLNPKNSGYFYADLSAMLQQRSGTAKATIPMVTLFQSAARPLIRHIDTLAATRDGPTASLSVQLRQPSATRSSTRP
ncbi:MAG: DUF3352 domain-containing protein [Phormidesmis sp.]